MSMREQNSAQVFEAETAPQNLALRPFRAIEQIALAVVNQQRRGHIAFDARRGSGGAEKTEFKQEGVPLENFTGVITCLG